MKKLSLTILTALVIVPAFSQEPPVAPDFTIIKPVLVKVADIGDMATAQEWFLTGLAWGSGIAALLFGFMTVRRALSMGDAWND